MTPIDEQQWWLTRVGNLLIWARLRIRPGGTAEIFDSSGQTLNYDSPDSALNALLDAEFRALDGLDDSDAAEFGLPLSELAPPRGDDANLPHHMVQELPTLQ